jgi:hypothetical protein
MRDCQHHPGDKEPAPSPVGEPLTYSTTDAHTAGIFPHGAHG